MSYEPPGFNKNSIYGHGKVYESTSKFGSALASFEKPVANGASRFVSRHDERKHKRNYKLLIDPALKKGAEKIFRFDGEFPGQPPIVPKDPRSRRTRIWTLNKADLPVPNFKYDKYYVGIPPQREVVFTGLNDNVDKKFLQEMCQKYGKVEHIKVYYDPLTKKHAGKARVTFDLTKSAKLACSKLNSCSVMGNIITTQLEPNLKGINPRPKLQKGTEKPHNKDPHHHPSSKPSLHYPTPPSTNSHSSPIESNLSNPCTPKLLRPADPRLRMVTPVTPPLPELSSTSSFQKSFNSQLSHSGQGSVFSASLASSTSSFEPISPPPANVKESVVQDTPLEGAPPLPPPINTSGSFLGYEDISPEQPPTPDATKKSFSTNVKVSERSRDESNIGKMIESLRKDSGRHSPIREHSRSPKTNKYSQDYKSHEQRHYDDRDKHRDRYYNRDYQDDKDYSSRRDSKRGDRYSEHRSGHSRHYDSWKESSYSDYKSRKSEYSRGNYRDDYDKRKRSDKRSDRYSTSPRRPEDRDRYMSSPHRSEERRSDSYNKDDVKRRGGGSPNDGETFPYTSSREDKRGSKSLRSVSPGKSGKSPVTSHSRKGPVSPVDSPNGRSSTPVYYTTSRLDTSSYSKKPPSPVEAERLRSKDVLRKRKLSDCTVDNEDNNFKSKRTTAKKYESENDHERYSPELFDESKNQNESSQNKLDVLPQVVDISPCPSPHGTVTVNAEVRPTEEPSSLYSDIETTDDAVTTDDKNDQDDDAMSLSSISSNEDTFELNEPSKKISPQPKPISVPPPNMVFSFPPPLIPPPPMIFNPHVPPPGMPFPPPAHLPPPLPGTIPPPHIPPPGLTGVPPMPPPIPPPNVMNPIVPGTYSTNYQHPMGGYLTQGFEYKPSKQEQYWNWKRQIIEVVSKTIHNELDAVLSRDVLRKLTELSAFKSLDAWWENQKKPKPSPSVSSSQHTATVGHPSSTSSTLLGPSPFDRPHNMALGFRTSLSFRRRAPEVKPEAKKAENLTKVLAEKSLSFGIPKKRQFGDRETEHDHDAESITNEEKRIRTISSITEDTDDDRSQSPWQHLDDSMEAAPPATDVRATKDRRINTGSSLYKTIYSSESESEEESDDKDESEDEQEQEEESSEEEVSSDEETDEDESEESEEDEEDEDNEEKQEEEKKEAKKLEHIDGKDIKDESLKDVIEEDVEVDISSANEDSLVETDQEIHDDITPKSTVETVTISQTANFDSSTTVPLLPSVSNQVDKGTDESSISTEFASDVEIETPKVPAVINEPVKEEEKDEIITKPDDLEDMKLDQEVKDITETQEKDDKFSIASLVELDHSYGLARKEVTPPIDVVGLDTTSEKKPPTVKEDVIPKVEKKPEVNEESLPPVHKHLFSARTFEQDDELVCEFLKSGLDYEDACFLKVGFDQLNQVCSQSVIGAKWSFHPVTAQLTNAPVPKRRRQKQDVGVRQHATGCARAEGYYKIDKKEKLRVAESAQKQVLEETDVTAPEEPKLDASKGKQLSRENRAMQRRLQSAVCNEDFADILKFNKLMVRKKQLKFAKSPIHDWGLVALEPIAADEMVIEYVGEMIRQVIADTRERHYEEHGIGSSYMFRLDEDTIIDATTKGNNARFINHCCEPNCYAKVIAMESEKKIVIYSKRDIQVNEEITYDYKFPLEDEKIPCLCGAAHCRGTLN